MQPRWYCIGVQGVRIYIHTVCVAIWWDFATSYGFTGKLSEEELHPHLPSSPSTSAPAGTGTSSGSAVTSGWSWPYSSQSFLLPCSFTVPQGHENDPTLARTWQNKLWIKPVFCLGNIYLSPLGLILSLMKEDEAGQSCCLCNLLLGGRER